MAYNLKYQGKNDIAATDIVLDIKSGGTGASDAATARTNLGIGPIATVTTPVLPLTNGGTGANNAENARANLGIGPIATITTSVLPIENGGIGVTNKEDFKKEYLDGTIKAVVESYTKDIYAQKSELNNFVTISSIGPIATVTSSILPLANGGTGANNAESARINLGIGSVATYGDNAPVPVTMGGTGVVSTQGLVNLLGNNLEGVSLPAKPKDVDKNEYIVEKKVEFIKGLSGNNAFKIKNNSDTKNISYTDDGDDNFTFEIKNSNFKITETTGNKQEDVFKVTPSLNQISRLIQIGDSNFQVDFTGNSYVTINDPFVALDSNDKEEYDYVFFIRNQDGTQQEIKQDNPNTFYFRDLNGNLQSINLSLIFNSLNNRYIINSDFTNSSFSGNGNGYTKLFDFLYPNMRKRNEYMSNDYMIEPNLDNYGRNINPLSPIEDNGWGADSIGSIKAFLELVNETQQNIINAFEKSSSPFTDNNNSILQKYLIILNDNNVVIDTLPSLSITFSEEEYITIFNNRVLEKNDNIQTNTSIIYPDKWNDLPLEEQVLAERYGGYLCYKDDNDISALRAAQDKWENVAKTYDYYWYLKFLEDYEKYLYRQDFESFKTMVNNNMGHVDVTSFSLPSVFNIIYTKTEKKQSSSKIEIKNLEVSNNLTIPDVNFKNNNSNHLILNQSDSKVHDFLAEQNGIGIYSNNIITLTPKYKGKDCGQLQVGVGNYLGTRLKFLDAPYAIPTAANTDGNTHYMGQIVFNSSNITNSVEASKRYSSILHYYPSQTHAADWSCPEIPRQALLFGHYAPGNGNLEKNAITKNTFALSLEPVIKSKKVINYTPIVTISSNAAKLAWRKALGNVPSFETDKQTAIADFYNQDKTQKSNAEILALGIRSYYFTDIKGTKYTVNRAMSINIKILKDIPAWGKLQIATQKKGIGVYGDLFIFAATDNTLPALYVGNSTETISIHNKSANTITKGTTLYFRGAV